MGGDSNGGNAMVDSTNPGVVETITAMNRNDNPEPEDINELLLVQMRQSCRLTIPLRNKQDFGKVSQVMSHLAGRLALIACDQSLTTLKALQTVRSDVDRANWLIKALCPNLKSSDGVRESAGT